jgi:hypothetical protein
MKLQNILIVNLIILVFLNFLTCTQNCQISGTIDETGTGKPTAVVTGLVVYENLLPVSGADVNLYNKNYISKMVVPLQKSSATSPTRSITRNTHTNINGIFRIDSVDTGKYYLELNDHDTLGALIETAVDSGDSVVTVNAFLKKLGTLKGTVDTSLVNKTGKTYVYISELQRCYEADSNGVFIAPKIPSYTYTLKIMHDTTAVVSPLDTIIVRISEGDTTRIGNPLVTALVKPTGTIPLSPLNNVILQKDGIVLSWTVIPDVSYNVQVSIDSIFMVDPVVDSILSKDSLTLGNLENSRSYFWRVRTINKYGMSEWSAVKTFSTSKALPQTPVPLQPTDQAANVPVAVTLTWTESSTEVRYHLQLSTESTFFHKEAEDFELTDTFRTFSSLQNGMSYFWRVQATNQAGSSDWSTVQKFTTIIAAPPAPVPVQPENHADSIHDTVTLSWSLISTAAVYYLQVADEPSFESLFFADSTVTSTSKKLKGIPDDTIFYWRLKAINAGGESQWSNTNTFRTKRIAVYIDLKSMSNWTTITGTASNTSDKLIVGDNINGGDKIESNRMFTQPFTLVWHGDFPSTNLSYHTMNVCDSSGTTSFSFWTRYQNPGRLGYTISVAGSFENVVTQSITATDNKINGEFKAVCENDTIRYLYNGETVDTRVLPVHKPMRISFTCYEHPFVIDSIYVKQY